MVEWVAIAHPFHHNLGNLRNISFSHSEKHSLRLDRLDKIKAHAPSETRTEIFRMVGGRSSP